MPASNQLLAHLSAFGPGLVVKMVTVMAMVMAMAMAMVIVIIVPEILRQVGWLHQRHLQSFHRPRAFY